MGERLLKELLRAAGEAITRFRMIGDGDRVLVALSGGKDSGTLLYLLRHLQSRAPVRFELAALTVDGGWGDHPTAALQRYCEALDVELIVEPASIVATVAEKLDPKANPCSLCARLRRGVIYRVARAQRFGTVALGHHADDLIETLLLNQLFNGQIKAMPPILRADDGETRVVRPLILADEAAIGAFARAAGLITVTCACPATEQGDLWRPQVKALVAELDERFPGSRSSLRTATGQVRETTLLDRRWLPLGEADPAPVEGPRPPPPPAPGALATLVR